MRPSVLSSVLIAALTTPLVGCGPEPVEPDGSALHVPAGDALAGHTTTEFIIEPEEFLASEMPMAAVEIPVLVGMNVDEAIADAERRGWTEILVHRLDSRDPFFMQTSLSPMIRIVLDVRDEVVVRAAAG